ncbi:MAG: hypothetical protein ACKOPG_00755 [Novosphingobium sp.]
MPQSNPSAADFAIFFNRFGYELRIGALALFAVVIVAPFLTGGDPAPQPTPPYPLALIASPDEPLMAEAIHMAQAPNAEDGPWAAGANRHGATRRFTTAHGSIVLSEGEVAAANSFYPQLKANPSIALSNSRRTGNPIGEQAGDSGD